MNQAINLAMACTLHKSGRMPQWMYYLDWMNTPAEIFSLANEPERNLKRNPSPKE